MLKLRKIAITGGIASGKTTVCRFFEELGAYVMSADAIVHHLLSSDTTLKRDLIELLGKEVVNEKGDLDRKVIAQIVFRDPALLKKLEKRVHPEVQKVIENQYQKISPLSYSLFVIEVPLLFESIHYDFYDKTIAVVAERSKCEERFMKVTGGTSEEFARREKRQLSMEEKQARADFVIENNGSLETLRQSVESIFKSLR